MSRPHAPILVATDLSPSADGAVRVGAALARRGQEAMLLVAPASAPADAADPLSRQLQRAVGAAEWPGEVLRVPAGSLMAGLASAARSLRPSLVVLPRPGAVAERGVDWEFHRSLLCRERIPVLAAHATLDGLPHNVLLTVDFSRSSMRAARAALRLLADDARVFLVHVQPDVASLEDDQEGWGVIYTQGIAGAFARLARELDLPPGVHIETVVLEGNAGPELLAFAARSGADLVVAGTHRSSFRPRSDAASVTSALLAGPATTLFLTPADPGSEVTAARAAG